MNSGTGKSFCVVYYVQLLNRARLTKRRQCCYIRPLQDCQKQRCIQSKEKIGSVCVRRDFKCNLREVIEVHVNQFCFVKIFTLAASSFRNNSPSSKQ